MPVISAKRMGKNCARALRLAPALFCLFFFMLLPASLAESDGMVRVRLTRLGAPDSVTLVADCDYCLSTDPTVHIGAGEKLTVAAAGEGLTLNWNGKKLSSEGAVRLMRTASGNRGAQFLRPELSNRFCGDLAFSASGGVVGVTLNIYVENYLYGVVGYEMPPSSPLEALKAQAVAARTYALRKKAMRADAAYDLTDTTADQVFKGYSGAAEYENVVRAVDETRGGALFYDGDLAQCYYCASNGGQTESAKNAWGAALDYTPVQDDPFDLESAAAVRTATVNKDLSGLDEHLKSALAAGIRKRLAEKAPDVSASDVRVNGIESVTACDSLYPAPSRVYKSLTFKLSVTVRDAGGNQRTGTVSVGIPTFGGFETWYDLSINSEDNETVWVTENERSFLVSFRRFGHGVGMSQRGAQVMAANYGKSAAEILAFYYPGVKGRVLELTDSVMPAEPTKPREEKPVIATARLNGKTDLLDSASEDGAPVATLAAGAAVDVYAVHGEWAAVGSGGKYGFIRTDALQSFALVGSAVTKAGDLAFGVAKRDAPVLQLPVSTAWEVSAVKAGDTVRLYAWTEAWAMLEAPDGRVGFVPLDALELVISEDAPEKAAPEKAARDGNDITRVEGVMYMVVAPDTAFAYQSWSTQSAVIASLSAGDRVQVGAYNARWACVRIPDGRKGFMRREDLTE